MSNFIPGVTPSRIQGYIDCKRRWAMANLFGLEEPDSEYTAFGTELHAVAERYFKTRVRPEGSTIHERCFLGGINFAPNPIARKLSVEETRGFDRIEGTQDLVDITDVQRVDETRAVKLYDWKTCGKISYRKSENALLKNPQFVVYGIMVCEAYDCEDIEAHWIYFCRKPNEDGTHDALPRIVKTTKTKLLEVYNERWRAVVDQMEIDQAKKCPSEFEKNEKACYGFGTLCSNQVTCILADKKRKQTMSSTLEKSSLFASLMEDEPAPSTPAKEVKPTDINPPDVPIEVIADDEKAKETKPKAKKTTKKKTKKKDAEGVPKDKGFTLYLRCAPIQGIKFISVPEVISTLARSLEEEHSVKHWSLMEYATGKGHLAAFVRLWLQAEDLDGESLVVTGYSDEMGAVESELINAAARIVVGVK